MTMRTLLMIAATAILAVPAIGAPTPAQDCQAGKNGAVGAYLKCRHKAERKLIAGDVTKYTTARQTCRDRLQTTWQRVEQTALTAGGVCPTSGDAGGFLAYLDRRSDALAAALRAGGRLPGCGDGAVNDPAEHCDAGDLGAATCAAVGFSGGTLACDPACRLETAGCTGSCAGASLPRTGDSSDGQAGEARIFIVDSTAGTITDGVTSLVWEMKDDAGGMHDRELTYTWSAAIAQHVDRLNTRCDGDETTPCAQNSDCAGIGNGLCGHAGHRDWRLPNAYELQSLINLGASFPAVFDDFHSSCTAGCALPSCSCTDSTGEAWTSSSWALGPRSAWSVDFSEGRALPLLKTNALTVRAVRGGG